MMSKPPSTVVKVNGKCIAGLFVTSLIVVALYIGQRVDDLRWTMQFYPTMVEEIEASKNTTEMSSQSCSNDVRKSWLKDMCARRHWRSGVNDDSRRTYWRILADDKHKMLYCVIPKVACTTFKTKMAVMTGKVAAGIPHEGVHNTSFMESIGLRYLNHFSKMEIIARLETYTKFIIVRHPFDRLFSAYMNKIVGGSRFVRRSISKYASRYLSSYDKKQKAKLSFIQFLELIAREYHSGFYDRHWASYKDLCHPCDIEYDYILKLETIDRDRWDFLERLGERRSNDVAMDHLNEIRSQPDKKRNVTESFPRLDEDVLTSLMAIYKADFELFGYGFSESGGATCDRTMDAGQFCC